MFRLGEARAATPTLVLFNCGAAKSLGGWKDEPDRLQGLELSPGMKYVNGGRDSAVRHPDLDSCSPSTTGVSVIDDR